MNGALRDIALRAAWFPSAVFLAHVLFSRAFRAYDFLPPLDIPMHLGGGVAIAYFFRKSLVILEDRQLVAPVAHPIRLVLLSALVASAAVFWEFAEYASDQIVGTSAQRGLQDTLLDMLMGIAGGTIFIAIASKFGD